MRTRTICKWSLGLCLTVLPFAGGCLQGASKSAVTNSTEVASVTASNAVVDTSNVAAMAAAATNAPAVDISEAEVRPLSDEKPLAPEVRNSGPTADLLKLAASGVEENVILSYVTNSPSLFNLSADEIIYLKDVGTSGAVVTAVLQHDQELKRQGVTESATAEPQALAATPGPDNYGVPTSNWINSAQQPAPSQVAPQPTAPYPTEGQAPAPPAEGVPTVAAPAPQVQVTYSSFYSSLAPYGNWVEVEGYGPVWQPTVVVVNRDWRPYFDGGRWIYTDHGWYWASDYSWGWAPFHYGRWFHHHRIGWCWAPDYVWGPAWVTWRYNDAYCGWAPLPPAAYYRPGFGFTYYGASVGFSFGFGLSADYYSFVHWGHFHDHYHHGHHSYLVPRREVHNVYNNTKVVTKIVGNNNTVINEGISAQRVSAATRTEIRKVSLREAKAPAATGGRPERFDPARKTLTVYKPDVPKAQRGSGGGIPMERVRTTTRTGGNAQGTTVARSGGTSATRSTRPREAGQVESRFGESSAAMNPRNGNTAAERRAPTVAETRANGNTVKSTVTQPKTASATGQNVQRLSEPASVESRKQPVTQPANAAANREPSTPGAASSRRDISRSQLSVPRTSASAANNGSPAAPQARVSRNEVASANPSSATPVSPNRTFGTPSVNAVPRALPAQPSASASPRAFQTPSRVERQATHRPNDQAFATPSTPAPAPRQYTAPSVSTPRTYEAPQRQVNAPQVAPRSYSAPTPSPAAPAQREFSAPAQRQYSAPPQGQRSYSAPAPVQRDFSASQPQRSYSAPAPTPPQREFSAPQRSSAPAAAEARGGGGGGRNGGGGGRNRER